MNLDDLQSVWARHDARLAASLRVDQRVLRALLVDSSRRALCPSTAMRLVEAGLGLGAAACAIVALGAADDVRTMALAPLVIVYLVGVVVSALAFVTLGAGLDHGQPVAELQRRVERMRLVEYAGLQWALLGGIALWLPLPLVVLEGVTGAPLLARIDGPWLALNLLFGAVVAAGARIAARRHLERADPRPFARRLREGLAGTGVRQAAAHLAELREFEA